MRVNSLFWHVKNTRHQNWTDWKKVTGYVWNLLGVCSCFLLGVHEIYLFNRRFTKFGGKDFGFLKYKKSDSTGIPPMW